MSHLLFSLSRQSKKSKLHSLEHLYIMTINVELPCIPPKQFMFLKQKA